MSFIGRLFGTDKAAESVINNVSNGIDKIWYTDEEKAEDAAEARREGYAVYMEWLKSTSGSRIARRIIAFLVTGVWVVQHSTALLFSQIAIFIDDPIKIEKLTTASTELFGHAQNNNALVGVVLLFYFGGPAAIDGVKGLVNKWTGSGK